MSHTHTTEIIREYPAPIITPNYPAIAIEELSQRYKALIEAERKHFMNTEHEYNDFIYKMDMIHQELEAKVQGQTRTIDELRRDNEELARRLRELENDYFKKSDTLKKLYYAYNFLSKKLEATEFDNLDLRTTVDKTSDRNFAITTDLKHAISEKNYLDERMSDQHSRHTMELNRLNGILVDKDKQILDRDREIDRLNAELRRVLEDLHRSKMDADSLRMNYEGMLRTKDIETAQLRRLLEEQRNLVLTENRSIPIVDLSGNEETIRRLKSSLEEAYRTIEKLSQRKHVEIIERPHVVEKVVEKIVEKPVERPPRRDFDEEERVLRSGNKMRSPRRGDDEDENNRWDEDRLERLLMIAERSFNKKLLHLYYIIWKLLFHIEHLDRLNKKQRRDSAGGQEREKMAMARSLPTMSADYGDSVISLYHDLRRGIVDFIFEIFIRSANHAHQKKVNSLILFIINIKELKERNIGFYLLLLDTFMRIRDIVKVHVKTSQKGIGVEGGLVNSTSPGASPDKRKTVDVEFRDMTNSWIQDTLESVKKRRNYDKHDPENMEYLYLFRLLAIKYRVIYPLRGKAFEVDMDLAVKLENKICKVFRQVMEIDDVNKE